MSEGTQTLTVAQVEELSVKLKGFAENLPEQEQQILGWLIERASAANDDDVAGYLAGPTLLGGGSRVGELLGTGDPFRSGLSRDLGRGLGFGGRGGSVADGTITVGGSWSFSF